MADFLFLNNMVQSNPDLIGGGGGGGLRAGEINQSGERRV